MAHALPLLQLNGGVEIHVDPKNEAMRESLTLCVGLSVEYSYRKLDRHTSRSMGDSLAGWWEEENKMFEIGETSAFGIQHAHVMSESQRTL